MEQNKVNDFFFDVLIKSLMDMNNLPGLSAAIVKDDALVWSKGYGYANMLQGKKATDETIYLISSVTKSILTTAILQLYEQGKFDLDDDVNQYLPFRLVHPNFPYNDTPITFRRLLSHRSGIYDYCLFNPIGVITGLLDQPIFPDDLSIWLRDRLIPEGSKYSSHYWMEDNPPGGYADYSNIGFLLLSYLFEIIAEETVEQWCQHNIFDPLEMNSTSFHLDDLDEDRLATLYHKRALGMYLPLPAYDYEEFAPMCGIRTTVKDLSNFLIAHMNNGRYKDVQLLQEDTMALMHHTIYKEKEKVIQRSAVKTRTYGFGWWSQDLLSMRVEGHGGFSPGAYCYILVNTSQNIGIVMQTNKFTITEFYKFFDYLYTRKIGYLICFSLFQKAETF